MTEELVGKEILTWKDLKAIGWPLSRTIVLDAVG
jgi:hypothetical protein